MQEHLEEYEDRLIRLPEVLQAHRPKQVHASTGLLEREQVPPARLLQRARGRVAPEGGNELDQGQRLRGARDAQIVADCNASVAGHVSTHWPVPSIKPRHQPKGGGLVGPATLAVSQGRNRGPEKDACRPGQRSLPGVTPAFADNGGNLRTSVPSLMENDTGNMAEAFARILLSLAWAQLRRGRDRLPHAEYDPLHRP